MGNTWHNNPDAITDTRGNVRFATAINDNNNQVISYKPTVDSEWQEWTLQGFEGDRVTLLSFTEDNQKVYVIAHAGQSTQALYLSVFATKDFE